MCRSEKDPDGPRSCSGHARTQFASASEALEAAHSQAAAIDAAAAGPESTKPLPANPNIKVRVPQTSDDPAVYVDPYPGMKGSDSIRVECGECSGSGVYAPPTSYFGSNPHQPEQTIPYHFKCDGLGYKNILVSSARSTARDRVKRHLQHQADIEDMKAKNEARRVEEERKEAKRRAAMVQGFVGEKGDKVGGLDGTIVADRTYESTYGYHKTLRRFLSIKLSDGRVVTTSGSGRTLFGPKRGEKVTIMSGTVGDHSKYMGQDQTALQRVKLAGPGIE